MQIVQATLMDWTYNYTIAAPDFTLPTNGSSTVNCPSDAVAPTPPAVTDACGRAITPQLPRHLLLPVTVRWSIPLLMQIVQATLMTGHILILLLLLILPFNNGSSTVNCRVMR
jgi:hypothetical protein